MAPHRSLLSPFLVGLVYFNVTLHLTHAFIPQSPIFLCQSGARVPRNGWIEPIEPLHIRQPILVSCRGGARFSSSLLESTADPNLQPPNNNEKQVNPNEPEPFEWDKIAKQAKLFWEMASPYFDESKAGRWLFAGMIGLTLVNSGVSVAFSYVSKDFWNALSAKDVEQFYIMLTKFAGALFVGAPVSVFYRFQRERLAISWREWMVRMLLVAALLLMP